MQRIPSRDGIANDPWTLLTGPAGIYQGYAGEVSVS